MKTELTQQQIERLFAFCRKHYVQYYDVQLELVDHIADIIEDLQKANPALSFSDALQMAGTQFSDNEFKAIVRSKKEQLMVRFRKLWWKEFVSYFTIPKVSITILLMFGIVWLGQHGKIYKFPMIAVNFLNVVNIAYFGKGKIIKQNKDDKVLKLLILKVLDRRSIILIVPLLFYMVLMFSNIDSDNPFFNILIYKLALYAFPLFFLVSLAWRKTSVEQNIFIRNQYPKAFAS